MVRGSLLAPALADAPRSVVTPPRSVTSPSVLLGTWSCQGQEQEVSIGSKPGRASDPSAGQGLFLWDDDHCSMNYVFFFKEY